MELKVWVEGIQRVVCGVTETTTCQDVVCALAHATGKTGRFTLIEKWRNSERLLAPLEFPRTILFKWGEYSSDVQFILQRTALEPKPEVKCHTKPINSHGSSSSSSGSPKTSIQSCSPKQSLQTGSTNSRDIKKALTFSGAHAVQPVVTAKEQNESFGEVGLHDGPKDFHMSPADHPIKPNGKSLPLRPPAPPPYDVVKGNPPPVPPHLHTGVVHYKSAIKTSDLSTNPVRVPPPYSRGSQFSKVRLSQPTMTNFPRGLPPYRDPPPPPPPSHPTLVKLTSQLVPQSNPEWITYHTSSIDSAGYRHYLPNNASITVTSDHETQESNKAFNSSNSHFNPYTSQSISTSFHHTKLKQNSSSSLRNPETNSSPSSIKVSPTVEHCHPFSEPVNKQKGRVKPSNSTELLANTEKPDKTADSEVTLVEKYECSNKLNGYREGGNEAVNRSGDINDNVLTPQAVIANRNQNGTEHGSPIKELFDQVNRQEVIDHNHSLDSHMENVVVDSYYKSLVKLVNMQREKLNSQQIDLTKHEAEIAYLDGRWKENESRLNYLQSEIQQLEKTEQINVDPESITNVERELEAAQSLEISMKNLLSELQEKYAACMNTIAQMTLKTSSLQEQLNTELEAQKRFVEIENEEEELAILREVEKLQNAVLHANKQLQCNEEFSILLSDEICTLGICLEAKRNEMEVLRQSMKEANLEALTMTPPDDSKQSPEGSWKSGTNRVMKGSPRQLETAVPTSKNPHGVWV